MIAAALKSETFGPLCAELRRAEADGHLVDRLLPHLAAARTLIDADDAMAVLHHRLAVATTRPATQRPARIGGIIPEARGPHSNDVPEALTVRARLIVTRATDLAAATLRERAPWVRYLPPRPPVRDDEWRGFVVAFAAYRELHEVQGHSPLGETQTSVAERDHARQLRTLQLGIQAQWHARVAAPVVDHASGPALG